MKASLAAACFVLALGGSAIAQAQGSATPAAPMMNFKQACSADVQRLCATAQTRKDQKKCIRQDRAQISQPCGTFLAEKRAQRLARKEQQGAAGAPASTPSAASPAGGPGH